MGKSEVFKHMFAAMRDVYTPLTVKMDMEHMALEAFIHFFYTGYVKEDAMDAVADKLLLASHKYGITLLHDLCQEKLMKCVHPDLIFQHYHLATRCQAEQLVHEIINFVATNFNDVSQINDYDQFLKDDPTLIAKLCNGVFKNLKLKLKDQIIVWTIMKFGLGLS